MNSFDSDQSMHTNISADTTLKRNLVADKQDLERAQKQMSVPSKDWTKLSNILRRSCGGSSRSRSNRSN